jgi:hypothetical protein
MNEEAQIRALLTGRALEYATQALGISHMARRSFREVFTVTRAEIDAYVAQHGIPKNTVSLTDDAGEGIHFVRREEKWSIYWAERGVRYDEELFGSESEACSALVTWLLRSSGTGIDFSEDAIKKQPNQSPQTTRAFGPRV